MRETIRTEVDRLRLIEYIKNLDINKPQVVSIETEKKKRSLNQNDMMWAWMEIIRKESHYDPKEVYAFCCQNFLPWIKREFWGIPIELVGGSSKLSTVEFSRFTDDIKQFMQEQDVNLPYPDEWGYDDMINKYGG